MKLEIEEFKQHITLFFITVVFGIASFLYKVRTEKVEFNFLNLSSEMLFSLAAAYIAYKISLHFGVPEDLLWAITAVAAWSGTRFMMRIEIILDKWMSKKLNVENQASTELDEHIKDN